MRRLSLLVLSVAGLAMIVFGAAQEVQAVACTGYTSTCAVTCSPYFAGGQIAGCQAIDQVGPVYRPPYENEPCHTKTAISGSGKCGIQMLGNYNFTTQQCGQCNQEQGPDGPTIASVECD